MNYSQDIYKTETSHSGTDTLKYYFVSKGERDIVKVVQYEYIEQFEGRSLYNFAFGDYDFEKDEVSDGEISNNGDQYKVFHTVLNTVPGLFDIFGNVTLMVQGSDSQPEFIDNCKNDCGRKCGDGDCKKAHRRINIYRSFVDKHFDDLSEEYLFMGGECIDNENIIEPYRKGKKYNAVFVMRKNA